MLKSKKKLCSIILAVVLLFSNVPAAFAVTKSASHDLSKGAITLTAKNGDIRVYGSYDGYGAGIRVKDGYVGTITLDNVTIDAKMPTGKQDLFTQCAIGIEYNTNDAIPNAKVTINVVGDNQIYGSTGIYSWSQETLVLTGTGTLEIGNENTDYGISMMYPLIIDAETIVNSKYTAIDAYSIVINAETTASGGSVGILAMDSLTINAKTTAYGFNNLPQDTGAGIGGANISINAPTYAEGRNGILAVGAYGGGKLTVSADTTAIGTKGYGVYSPTNITVDNATLTAKGTKKGVKIGNGQKNTTIGNGKITAKTIKK